MDFDIHIERPKVIWRQVTEQIRNNILSGKLPAGTKLPSTAQLAAQSGADVKTVHRALTDLVKEGLITRARKVGTYVTDRNAQLSRIGIYYPFDVSTRSYARFLQAMNGELHQLCHEARIATRLFVDQRPMKDQDTPPPDLEDAAREKHIQGLISTTADSAHMGWLDKLKVPVAYIGAETRTSVRADVLKFVETALRTLKEKGVRSAGFVVPLRPSHTAFFRTVAEASARHGIEVRPAWVRHIPENAPTTEPDFEALGYSLINDLWELPERPESLVIYPDTLVRGALMALMSKRVRVPEELKLVLHKNDEVDLFCPLPATLVVFSVRENAEGLLHQLRESFHGRPTEPILLGFKVAAAPGVAARAT